MAGRPRSHPCPICGTLVRGRITCSRDCYRKYHQWRNFHQKTVVAIHPLVRQAMTKLKWPTYVHPRHVVETLPPVKDIPDLADLPRQNLIIGVSMVLRTLGYVHWGCRYFERLKMPVLLFRPEHVQLIISREDDPDHKTQSRRRWTRLRVKPGGLMACTTKLFTRDRFAVIKVREVIQQPLGEMTEDDARAEGGYTLETYRQKWEEIYEHWNPEEVVTVLKFDRFFTGGPIRNRRAHGRE